MKKIIFVIMCSCVLLSGCGRLNAAEMFDEVSVLEEATDTGNAKEEGSQDESDSANEADSESNDSSDEAETIFVYVCGQVVNPGVYELIDGSRVFEAIELAGGLTEFADETRINLAQTLSDEQQVYIPEIGETFEDSLIGGESANPGIDSDGRVNINTATVTELMTLPGIGQSKAESIISFREKNGNFGAVSDIMNVDGIKNGTYEKIKDCITIK